MISCLHPINLPSGIVPCGHCILCANRQKRQWIVRNILESRFHQEKCFLTLTFDPEHLIDFGHRQIDLFFKRLRKNKDCSFRYFGCFERGDSSYRPHFHILIYGWQPEGIVKDYRVLRTDEEILSQYWRNGFVDVKPFDENCITYVCRYVQKKVVQVDKPEKIKWSEFNNINKWSTNDFDFYTKLEEFYRTNNIDVKLDEQKTIKQTYFFMSKGLGYSWFVGNSNENKVLNQKICLNGQFRIVPKAFRDKLKRDYEDLVFPEIPENSFEYSLLSDEEKLLYHKLVTEDNQVKANNLNFFYKL